MDAMMRLQEYWHKGNVYGMLAERERVARRMLKDGSYTTSQITNISILPQDRIEAIRNKMGL